ncbi:MAG TPA: DNA methyltransferase [Tepidisphaeraceae bacterium]|nr:DNA methyltransferase [Tepidisphaeraceae bacterium]
MASAPRKPRVWATTRAEVRLLGRGAKLMAKKSAARLATPAVKKSMVRLRELLRAERLCKLQQGDVLVQLIDRHQLRAIDIARRTIQRPSDLSQMYHTCRMFPPRVRRRDVPYNTYFLATRIVRKFRHLKLSPGQVLAEIQRLGFSQHRQVTAHFAAKETAASAATVAATHLEFGAGPFDRAYHTPFQSLLKLFPDRLIKVLHVDPPYVYPRRAAGRYGASSARPLSCDNRDAVYAIALVNDLLREWQAKLAPGGVLLLWQPSGPLPHEISQAMDEFHWEVDRVVIWDKGRPQAGDLAGAYQTQCEWLWVIKRPGERLLNHDASPRGDIVRFAPVSAPQLAAEQQHAFEKPLDLCRFLVGKHSHPGELVFDCCGCTGSMSVAAIETGRRWVYAESNTQNHARGSARIARALGPQRTAQAG